MTIRVLVADDQPLMRAAFEMTLRAEDDIEFVGEAADGRAAIEQARALHPDVVLMDIRMPELDGVEATRILTAENAAMKILILTTFDIDEYVLEALRAGASGFLLKDVRADELVARDPGGRRRRHPAGPLGDPPSARDRIAETRLPSPEHARDLETLTPTET